RPKGRRGLHPAECVAAPDPRDARPTLTSCKNVRRRRARSQLALRLQLLTQQFQFQPALLGSCEFSLRLSETGCSLLETLRIARVKSGVGEFGLKSHHL